MPAQATKQHSQFSKRRRSLRTSRARQSAAPAQPDPVGGSRTIDDDGQAPVAPADDEESGNERPGSVNLRRAYSKAEFQSSLICSIALGVRAIL